MPTSRDNNTTITSNGYNLRC